MLNQHYKKGIILLLAIVLLLVIAFNGDKEPEEQTTFNETIIQPIPENISRKFYMGLTPFPYDISTEAVENTYSIDVAVRFDMAAAHLGVAVELGSGKSPGLYFPCPGNPLANISRRLGTGFIHEVLVRHGRHLHMNIDAVQQRSGDLRAIAVHLLIGAAAFVFGIGEISAGTRIHSGHQHEAGRIGEGGRSP